MAFSIFFNVPSGKYKSISNNINAQKLTFFINFKKYNDFFFFKNYKNSKNIYIYIFGNLQHFLTSLVTFETIIKEIVMLLTL